MFRYKYTFKAVIVLWIFTFAALELYKHRKWNKHASHHTLHIQRQKEEVPYVVQSTFSLNYSNAEEIYKVPNIVHYIWYNEKPIELRFDQALSVWSTAKYIKPDVIYLHTNNEPCGPHYDKVKKLFKVIARDPPIGEVEAYFKTTYSDYDRLKILIEQGGIYLDFDVMATKSFDDLRKYSCTIGYERPERISGGIVICAKNEPFLHLWKRSFYNDHRPFWGYNSGGVPHKLAVKYPDLIHTEETKLNRPNCKELEKIWGNESYPWRDNYAIHTWIRMLRSKRLALPTPDSIRTMNSTYGEIARNVIYGSSDIKQPLKYK